MNWLYIGIGFLFVAAHVVFGKTESKPAKADAAQEVVISDSLRSHAERILRAGNRSYANPPVQREVQAFIEGRFAAMGLETRRQVFRVDGVEYVNVIGVLNPDLPGIWVIGAHYDVCGNQPGADDNASGVAGLIELARLLAAKPCRSLAAPASLVGVDFSDHRNYWTFGYAAVMVTDTAFMRNKNYHRSSDTIDTLDFGKMAQVVLGLAGIFS